jgi:hypothetical protein
MRYLDPVPDIEQRATVFEYHLNFFYCTEGETMFRSQLGRDELKRLLGHPLARKCVQELITARSNLRNFSKSHLEEECQKYDLVKSE